MANKVTHMLATLVISSGILASANAMACSSDAYTGSVCLMAATFCPDGYVEANGAPVTNQMLKSVLGSDKLPSLQAPAGTKYCVSVSGPYPPRP